MFPAKMPCFCIDTGGLFMRLSTASELLWIFTIFCAFMAVGLLLCGVFAALLNSWLILRLAGFIRGEKRKRKNEEL